MSRTRFPVSGTLRHVLGAIAIPAALLALAACNPDDVQVALADGAKPVITRAASHPAWGDTRWTMRYAHNGRCDDSRYANNNGGRAEPGSDEADCQLYGGGLAR